MSDGKHICQFTMSNGTVMVVRDRVEGLFYDATKKALLFILKSGFQHTLQEVKQSDFDAVVSTLWPEKAKVVT